MLIGMTGFGRAHYKDRVIELTLQIRSVNSRYFEVAFHMPPNLAYLEDDIRQYLHKRIRRGRVSFNLFLSGVLAGGISVNKELARQYVKTLRKLKKELGLSGEVAVAQLSAFPGVITLQEGRLPEEIIRHRIEKLVAFACDNLLSTRIKEGKALAKDVLSRIANIHKKLSFIKQRVALFIAQKQKLAKGGIVSPEEISAAIKACDISEEITRLYFHLKAFADKASSVRNQNNAIGKELDFIAQEMQREANTMGAKSQDARLGSAVIEIKSQIEKIREQAQNVE